MREKFKKVIKLCDVPLTGSDVPLTGSDVALTGSDVPWTGSDAQITGNTAENDWLFDCRSSRVFINFPHQDWRWQDRWRGDEQQRRAFVRKVDRGEILGWNRQNSPLSAAKRWNHFQEAGLVPVRRGQRTRKVLIEVSYCSSCFCPRRNWIIPPRTIILQGWVLSVVPNFKHRIISKSLCV